MMHICTKPLPRPLPKLTFCQHRPCQQSLKTFWSKHKTFLSKNAFVHIVCIMATILLRSDFVKTFALVSASINMRGYRRGRSVLGLVAVSIYLSYFLLLGTHNRNNEWPFEVPKSFQSSVPYTCKAPCYPVLIIDIYTLQWRHNERDSVLIHRRLDSFLNRLFRRRSKKTVPRHWAFFDGDSPAAGGLPLQKASDAENVSIWWRHHEIRTLPSHVFTDVPAYALLRGARTSVNTVITTHVTFSIKDILLSIILKKISSVTLHYS